MMQSFSSLIEAIGPVALSEELGIPRPTIYSWKLRNALPPRIWPQIVTIAKKRRVPGVSYELLVSLAAKRSHKSEAA